MRYLIITLFAWLSLTAHAAEWIEGEHYVLLDKAQQTPVKGQEVKELFFYGCTHCYEFEPFIKRWKKSKPADIAFVRQPALFNQKWAWGAQTFYTAQALNIEDKVHDAIFNAMFGSGKKITSVKDIQNIFMAHGASAEDFDKHYFSFAVGNQVRQALKLTRQYAIDGVPALTVNGKYRTSPSMAGGKDEALKLIDYLLSKP